MGPKELIFLPPFVVNLALILRMSYVSLLTDQEEHLFPSIFVFVLIGTILGPAIIISTRLLPDPSHVAITGGVITILCLLWAALVQDRDLQSTSEPMTFGLLTGCGICISFVASCVGLSPLFERPNDSSVVYIMAMSAALMTLQPVINTFIRNLDLHPLSFIAIVTLIIVAAFIPSGLCVINRKREQKTEFHDQDHDEKTLCQCEKIESEECSKSICGKLKMSSCLDRYLPCLKDFVVWIFWGTGVDLTLMSLSGFPNLNASLMPTGKIISHYRLSLNIVIIQSLASILVCMTKLFTHLVALDRCYYTAQRKRSFSSNYMHLGLLGAMGLVLGLFLDNCDPSHIQVLFALTFALQINDINDVVRGSPRVFVTAKLDLCKRSAMSCESEKAKSTRWKSKLIDDAKVMIVIFGVISLILVSLIAVLLGLQLASLVVYCILYFEDLLLFSRHGLCMVSVISIFISLSQPEHWLRKRYALPTHSSTFDV